MELIARAQSKFTYPNIGVTVCFFLLIALLGAGQAYAINTIRGEDVVDGSLSGADIGDRTLGVDDLGTDSVGFRALQYGSVTNSHLRNGTITGASVADRSLTAADMELGYEVVQKGPFSLGPNSAGFDSVGCNTPGSRVVGGGAAPAAFELYEFVTLDLSAPSLDGMRWHVAIRNNANFAIRWHSYAVCLRVR